MVTLTNILLGLVSGFVLSMLWWNADLSAYWWFLFGVGIGLIFCFICYKIMKGAPTTPIKPLKGSKKG